MALAALGAVAAQAQWEKGAQAPDFSRFNVTGEAPAFEGKVTYVDFWASWCPPCKAAFPAIEELYQEYKDEGFQVVAVSVDSTQAAMQRFLDRAQPSFVTVWDTDQDLAANAGIEVMPTSFLIGPDGTIRSMHRGWGGDRSKQALEAEIKELLAEK